MDLLSALTSEPGSSPTVDAQYLFSRLKNDVYVLASAAHLL